MDYLKLKSFAPHLIEAAEAGPIPAETIMGLLGIKQQEIGGRMQWAFPTDEQSFFTGLEVYFQDLRKSKILDAPKAKNDGELTIVFATQGSRRRDVLTKHFNLERAAAGEFLVWKGGYYASEENLLHGAIQDGIRNPHGRKSKDYAAQRNTMTAINFLLMNEAVQKKTSIIYQPADLDEESIAVIDAIVGAGYNPKGFIVDVPLSYKRAEANARFSDKAHRFARVEDYIEAVERQHRELRAGMMDYAVKLPDSDIYVGNRQGKVVHAMTIKGGKPTIHDKAAAVRFFSHAIWHSNEQPQRQGLDEPG